MSCITKTTYKQLLEIYKDEKIAETKYNFITNPKFLLIFGDWKNNPAEKIDPNGTRLNEQGEPKLFTSKSRGKTYAWFISKDNSKIDITGRSFENLNIRDRTNKVNEVVNSISYNIYNQNIKENFNNLELINNIDINKHINDYLNDIINNEKRRINTANKVLSFNDVELAKKLNLLSENSEITDKIKEKIESTRTNVKVSRESTIDRLNFAERLLLNNEEIKGEIISFFKSKGLTINENTENVEEIDENEDNSDRGEKANSVEKNTKDKASANMKLLFSFIPEYEVNPNYKLNISKDRFQKVTTLSFGSQKLMDGAVVHENLLKDLSDLVTVQNGNNVTDLYKQMINVLTKLSTQKPFYKDIVNILENEDFDDNKRNEFVSAMMHFSNRHIVSDNNISKRVYKKYNAAAQTDLESKIIKNWSQAFDSLYKDNKGLIKSKIDSLNTKLSNLKSRQDSIIRDLLKDNVTEDSFAKGIYRLVASESTDSIMSVLKSIGLKNINENTLYSLIHNVDQTTDVKEFRNEVIKMIKELVSNLSFSIKDLNKNLNTKNYNFIEDNKARLFLDLAISKSISESEVKDSSVYSMGKMFWVYGNPSYLSNMVHAFKQNPEILRQMSKNTSKMNSQWIQFLLGEDKNIDGELKYNKKERAKLSALRLEEFKVNRMLEYKVTENAKKIDSKDNKKISLVDQTVDRIQKIMLASIKDLKTDQLTGTFKADYSTIQPADKSSSMSLETSYFITDTLDSFENSNKLQISDKVLDIFYGYWQDEYARMYKEYKLVEHFEKMPFNTESEKQEKIAFFNDKFKIHIHVNPKLLNVEEGKWGIRENNDPKGKLVGQGFKSQITPDINYDSLKKVLAGSNLFRSDNSPIYARNKTNSDQKIAIKKLMNEMFTIRLKENVSDLMSKGIVKQKGERYDLKSIDKKIIESYSKEFDVTTLTKASLYNFIADYTINDLISNVEYTKLFTGDPAYYKEMTDFFKRVPATYTDGIQLRLGLTENDATFNMSVVKDSIIGSEFYSEMEKGLKNLGKTDIEIESIIGAYKKGIDQTDAQAWIRPERWKFILERSGKWAKNPELYQSVYDKMMLINKEPFTEKELKYSSQPLKGVYFGVVNGVPTYMKYSQAVISPMLVSGSKMQKLYDSMKDNNIDEMVTLSGVKVGASIPTDIEVENIKFNKQVLNNNEWKLQQDLPVKLMKNTLLGSQIQKNIYSSVKLDETYKIGDQELSGTEIIKHINDIISKISDTNTDRLSVMLGMDTNYKIGVEEMYEILQNEINDDPNKFSENVKFAIDKQLPFELIPGVKNKIHSTLFSKIRKAASNIMTNGGSFIQMSNYTLDQRTADENGVTWLVDQETGLKPPLLYKDKETGQMKVSPGQIFISHSIISKIIPNYRQLAKEGKLKDMLDKDILKAVGYRIPNQGMSSNDSLEVVGILPAHMNDTIVAYSEITTKTGSDFDIDKMFIMLPEVKTLYSKRTYANAKSYLNDIIKGNNIDVNNAEILNDFYDELIEQTNIELTSEELTTLMLSSDDYLMSDNYFQIIVDNIVKGDSELSKKFEKQYEVGEVSKIVKVKPNTDSIKGLNNMLFDAYTSILEHPNTYTDLIQPLDFPHVVDHIKALHKEKEVNENFKFFDGLYQLKLKNTYFAGKAGVGVFANHAVDHNISKNGVNLGFKDYYLGVGFINENNETVFDRNPETMDSSSVKLTIEEAKLAASKINEGRSEKDYVNYKNLISYKIGDTISAFMNGAVDNAKDPYLERGNYNSYTLSPTSMLIRSGAHPYWIDAFMGTPVLKELNSFVNNYESISIEKDKADAGQSAYNLFLNKLISEHIGTNDIRAINKRKKDFMRQYAEENGAPVFSYKEYSEMKDRGMTTIEKIITVIKFKEFQDQAKELDKSINLSRMDTLGSGRSFNDMLVYENKLIDLINNQNKKRSIKNHLNKYYNNGNITSLGTQLKNSILLAGKILNANPKMFFSSNRVVLDVINDITMNTSSTYGKSLGRSTDSKIISKITNEMFNYTMSQFPLFKNLGNPLEYVKNVKNELINYKENQNDKSKNAFVQSLTFNEDSFGIDIGSLPIETKNLIGSSFYDLYRNNKPLAKKVIISSFLMTGMNQTLIDFNEMIPHEFYQEYHKINETEYQSIEGYIKEVANENNNVLNYDNFHKLFVQNNYFDNRLAPVISQDMINPVPLKNVSSLFYLNNTKALKSYAIASEKQQDGTTNQETIAYSRFLKAIPTNKKGSEILLEYKGNIRMNIINEEGKRKMRYTPIYEAINKRGFISQSSKVQYKEYESADTQFEDNKLKIVTENSQIPLFTENPKHTFIPLSKIASVVNSNDKIKKAEELEEFIFNKNMNELLKNTVFEENVVSLPGNEKENTPSLQDNNMPKYYEGNITPNENTVFVFGSNPEGRHGAGAAKIARNQFGAIYGQGEGLQGNAYAIPTKDLRIKENKSFKSISEEKIVKSISKMYVEAQRKSDKLFKVAYRNTTETSLNGYTGLEMIEMFNEAATYLSGETIPSNVIFSKEWYDTGLLEIKQENSNNPLDCN